MSAIDSFLEKLRAAALYFLQKKNSAVVISKEISKSLESPFHKKISTTAFKLNNLVIYYPRDVTGISNRIKLRAQMECKIIITIIIIMIVIIVIMTIIITISHIYKASLFVSAEVCNI